MFWRQGSTSCPFAHQGASSAAALVLAILALSAAIGPAWATTVVIRQLPQGVHDTQLLDAFHNKSVDLIVLGSDYAVGNQFERYSGGPQVPDGVPYIPITR